MNWLWPREISDHNSIAVRIARVIHWSAIGFAVFGTIATMFTLVQDPTSEPLTYFAVLSVWASLVMLGRGVRYIMAKE